MVHPYGGQTGCKGARRQGPPWPRSSTGQPWTGQRSCQRAARDNGWRIAATTAAGKSWRRVRGLDRPLSEHECYRLLGYRESAEAGEVIRIADRSSCPGLAPLARDFWLFDADTARPFAALLNHNHAGEYLGAAVTTEPAVIMACVTARNLAQQYSVPHGAYLAQLKAETE